MDTIPDDLSIPSFLRRDLTPQARAAITRTNNELRRRDVRRVVASGGRSTISAGHAANLDETGKALLKEIRTGERKKAERERARLAALPKKEKGVMAKTIGKKEQALRATRTGGSKTKPKLAALAAMIPGGANVLVDPAAKDVVADLKNPPPHAAPANGPKRARAAKPAKAAKAAKAVGGRPDGLREGSKQAIMLDMVLAKDGATEEAICKKLGGWKRCRVTLTRVCDKVGAELVRDEKTGRFHATMRKAA